MRRVGLSLAILTMLNFAAVPAWPQAGNVGGTIGKTDRPSKKPAARSRTPSSTAKVSGCGRSLVGSWVGTAGVGSVTMKFNADGSATTDNGFTGRWRCDGGAYVVTWHTGSTSTMQLSSDGKSFTGTAGVFGIGFKGTRQ